MGHQAQKSKDMKTMCERKIIIEPGVSFEVAKNAFDYYEKEHFLKVSKTVKEETERIKGEKRPEWTDEFDWRRRRHIKERVREIFQESAVFLNYDGLIYKVYITRHTFRITLISGEVENVNLP